MSIKIDNGFLGLFHHEHGTCTPVWIKGSEIVVVRSFQTGASLTLSGSSPYGGIVLNVSESPAEILQAVGESYKQARAARG